MPKSVAVMPGPRWFDISPLQSVAREFGWDVDIVDGLNELVALQRVHTLLAIAFRREALGPNVSWFEALHKLKSVQRENVHLIACVGFGDPVNWPQVCEAGAFSALWVPLKENEVRFVLGFVWQAENRLAAAASETERRAQAALGGILHRA